MPARSAKQYALMQMVAHQGIVGGPSKNVAEEFIKKTPPAARSKFASALKKKKK